MQRNVFFAVLIASTAAVSAWAAHQSDDGPPGSINTIAGYKHEQGRGEDTDVGKIWKEGGLTINYDIGTLAGPRANPEHQADYSWYKEQPFGGQRARCALTKSGQLLVTFPADSACFYANVETPEDVADMLLIVLTYRGQHGP